MKKKVKVIRERFYIFALAILPHIELYIFGRFSGKNRPACIWSEEEEEEMVTIGHKTNNRER